MVGPNDTGPLRRPARRRGIKAIALAGACAVLEERGFQPRNVAGTSAGALVAALLAAGYSARNITDLVFATNFAELRDRGWEDRLPLVRRTFAVLEDLGVYEGNALEEWTRELPRPQGDPDIRRPRERGGRR